MKHMKNKKIIQELKKLNPEDQVIVTLTFNKKSLTEINYVNGTWQEKNYFCEASTLWRAAELFTDEMSVNDIIELLEKKNISEIDQSDFNSIQLVESSDGSTEVYDIEWDDVLTEEELELAPSGMDMYWEGDITDSDYEFGPDSIFEMKIECGDFIMTINE
jgi:hypothetical protein